MFSRCLPQLALLDLTVGTEFVQCAAPFVQQVTGHDSGDTLAGLRFKHIQSNHDLGAQAPTVFDQPFVVIQPMPGKHQQLVFVR